MLLRKQVPSSTDSRGGHGTLYLGVTSDLPGRVYQHRTGQADGFSKLYGCRNLVWYAPFDDIQDARARELQMKKWKRAWKLQAIEQANPDWRDLFEEIAH